MAVNKFDNEIKVPGPAASQAIVYTGTAANATVVLYNMAGVQVAAAKMAEKGSYVLQLQQLPASSMYVVEVASENGKQTIKLLKE